MDIENQSVMGGNYYTLTLATPVANIINATFETDGASVKSVQEGYTPGDTVVGTVPDGTLSVTGGDMNVVSTSTTLESNGLSDGYAEDTRKKISLSTTKQLGYYELEAKGNVIVSRSDINKQVTSAGYFEEDNSPAVVIPGDNMSVTNKSTKYYVPQSTLSAYEVNSSNANQAVVIGPGYYHIERTVLVRAMNETYPVTSLANTGMDTYFTPANSVNGDVSITPRYSNTTGYLSAHTNYSNGGTEYYKIKEQTITETVTTTSSNTIIRGTRTESSGWANSQVTLDTATFSNTGTSGETYADISADTSPLAAGDYLYINKGWTDNVKIGVEKLVSQLEGITLTKSDSGTRTFSVTVPNDNATSVFLFTVDASGNVTITES